MKLKFLNVDFQVLEDFFAEVSEAMKSGKGLNSHELQLLKFDSVKSFNSVLTVNRLQILKAISQLRPESVYQLATFLDREPHHVLKDCRFLETYNFIRLDATESARSSLRPVLTFDYDVIRTNSPIVGPYTISERSEKQLLKNQTAS